MDLVPLLLIPLLWALGGQTPWREGRDLTCAPATSPRLAQTPHSTRICQENDLVHTNNPQVILHHVKRGTKSRDLTIAELAWESRQERPDLKAGGQEGHWSEGL